MLSVSVAPRGTGRVNFGDRTDIGAFNVISLGIDFKLTYIIKMVSYTYSKKYPSSGTATQSSLQMPALAYLRLFKHHSNLGFTVCVFRHFITLVLLLQTEDILWRNSNLGFMAGN